MKTILHIDSSAKSSGSATRSLTADALVAVLARYPDAEVIYRDVTSDPLPHINPEFLAGIFAGGEAADHATVQLSDKLVEELFAADIIVIGAPMYNFGIPSQLKSWLDYILRAGKTFRYTESGPVGLVTGKSVIVAIASGGTYSAGPRVAFDHVGPYMQQVLGFIGISDVKLVRAENQAMGPEAALASLTQAKSDLQADVKQLA